MKKTDLHWYACVYEGEQRVIYGRAPIGNPDQIVEDIKRSLRFHKLIGLQSKVFLSDSRFKPDGIVEFCERNAAKNEGDYQGFKAVKLDLRWSDKEVARRGL